MLRHDERAGWTTQLLTHPRVADSLLLLLAIGTLASVGVTSG